MAEEVAVGYVRLIPSMRGFGKATERGLKNETRRWEDVFGQASDDAGEESGKRFSNGFGRGVGKNFKANFGKALTGGGGGNVSGLASKLVSQFTGAFSLSAKTLATGFSAQFTGSVIAGIASGIGKMAHGLAALAALLPAAATAGVVAFATLKIAVLGVADALSAGLTGDTEAFNEALKSLSPSAREFARSVVGMRDQIDGLKRTVQERFFSEFADQTKALGATYLPVVESTLGGVASSFGRVASDSIGFLTLPSTSGQLSMALGHVEAALDNVAAAVVPVLRGFLPLVTVGSTFLPQLTNGLQKATEHWAGFMTEAAATGQLAGFISGGLDKLEQLWQTAGQLWRILKDVGAIFSMLGGFGGIFSGLGIEAGGLLDGLEQLTGRARAFFETSEGGAALAEGIRTIRNLVNASMGLFQHLAGIIAPFAPQIAEFATMFENMLTAIVDAAQPAIEVFLGGILPAVTSFGDWIARNKPVLQGLLIGLFTAWAIHAGIAAAATIAATWPFILIGVAVAALAALFITHFDTIKNAVLGAFNWIKTNWPLLLTILTGPIGIAVALIVHNWDTIKNAAIAAFNWVKTNWPLILAILTGPIGLAVLVIKRNWQTIKDGFTAVKTWIGNRVSDIVGFITGIPHRISSAVSTMWDGIKNSFKSVINAIIGWWNGLSFTLPSIHIPGFDPPGPGPSFAGATIGGQTFSTPNIDPLAKGALVTGPTLALVGEGRESEGVAPMSKLEAMVMEGAMKLAFAAGGGRASVGPSRLVIDVTGGENELIRMVRKWIANNTTGDVQVALGPRR